MSQEKSDELNQNPQTPSDALNKNIRAIDTTDDLNTIDAASPLSDKKATTKPETTSASMTKSDNKSL